MTNWINNPSEATSYNCEEASSLDIQKDLSLLANNCLSSDNQKNLFSEVSTMVCQSLLAASRKSSNQIDKQGFQTQIQTPDRISDILQPGVNLRSNYQPAQYKHELLLPNDLIGCIIGRGGKKINDIRQQSQANIKISSAEEGVNERRITITGTLSALQTAERMINASVELHKHLLALNMALNAFDPRDKLTDPPSTCPTTPSMNGEQWGTSANFKSTGAKVASNTSTANYIGSDPFSRYIQEMAMLNMNEKRPVHSTPAQLGMHNTTTQKGHSTSLDMSRNTTGSAGQDSVSSFSLILESVLRGLNSEEYNEVANGLNISELIRQLAPTEQQN